MSTTDLGTDLEAAPPPEGAPARTRRPVRLLVAGAVIAAAIGFLVFKGLGDATVYFKTADEAVAEKDELGARRFRVEGLVVDPVVSRADGAQFSIISAGTCVAVRHRGSPPELFQPGIPVVLEGRWDGEVYASDRIMVKHTTEYREQNPERLAEARTQPLASCPPVGDAMVQASPS